MTGFKLDLASAKELGNNVADTLARGYQAYQELPWYYKLAIGTVVVPIAKTVLKKVAKRVPKGTILELDLHQATQFVEYNNPVSFPPKKDTMAIYDLVLTLQKAKMDANVRGLICYVGNGAIEMPLAQIQELRDAVADFATSGKFTICYANSFGEVGSGIGAYYLATAFGRIVTQPGGIVGLSHLMSETPFIRNMLDKLGLEPLYSQRHEYKNMKNMITETKYTKAHREATESMLLEVEEAIVAGIAEGRKISKEKVAEHMDSLFVFDDDAVAHGLVDDIKPIDQLEKELDAKKKDFFLLSRYQAKVGRGCEAQPSALAKIADKILPPRAAYWLAGGPHVALVVAAGGVTVGKAPVGEGIGSHTTVNNLRAAAEDELVKAIIFRVDTGGGSAVGSEAIAQEIDHIQRDLKKPVIVSMGNMAASGGYYISCLAKKIVAHPCTFTGSIGVVAGKFYTPEFWNKLGITWDDVEAGPNASMFTGRYKRNEVQGEIFEKALDKIYLMFKSIVARGRNLTLDEVEELAKGRVWMGRQAHHNKLVDRLGGLSTAMAVVKEELGLNPTDEIGIRVFPQTTLLGAILGGPKKSTKEPKAAISYGPLSVVMTGLQWVESTAPAIHQAVNAHSGGVTVSAEVPRIL
eukprot:comp24337_c1_seq1/m.46250 comp24337_c1_seq1/g.46250  ORF comp24337_c1_seq1/g.46250 comp24337_c1_seq1/m.46250 type:complete len:635 (-) comp24337_c1_seq1:291-2195(-)